MMNAIWQRSFADFAGPGIDYPADMMRVSEDEAREILARFNEIAWQGKRPVQFVGGDTFGICNAVGHWTTGLVLDDQIIGFYAGSCLWIRKEYRGLRLSTPLILAAATHRGGSCMPPGIVSQGYTSVGLAAHRAAYRQAVVLALAEGLPVPASVIAALELAPERFATKIQPAVANDISMQIVPAQP